MARRIPSDTSRPAETRSNPDLFGEDLVPLGWEALGIGIAAFGNDRIVGPIARQVLPVSSAVAEGKLVDALTTAATGWAAGEVVGMASRPAGNRVRRGGVLLGVAKLISAFVPGFSISASFPNLPLPTAAPAVSNGNGNGKVVQLPTATSRLGVGTMGL